MKKMSFLIAIILVIFAMTSCTAGPNELANSPDNEGEVAGFWQGAWHGVISPVTFVVSLFSDSVYVYEVHNNGGWYNFGFLLGVSIIFGGSGGGAARRRR